MNNSNDQMQVSSNSSQVTGRWKLVALWMTPIGLMLLAALVYWMVQKDYLSLGSINKGNLIQPPLQLNDWAFVDSTGNAFNWDKWSLVIRGASQCDQQCLDDLYLSRQVHIRLDKKANQIQRIYLLETSASSAQDSSALAQRLEADHPYLKFIHTQGAAIETIDNLHADAGGYRYFLVDPNGWAMMTYNAEHEAADLLKDIKYLLKYANQ